MQEQNIAIAPEGFPIIALLAVTALCAASLHWGLVTILILLLLWLAVNFFRDPERVPPEEEGVAASPADGKVIRIAEREDPFTGQTRVCVSIFMNLFNVHVNRAPVEGKITSVKYTPGDFFNASWDKASRDNERCAWQLKGKDGKEWVFVQIAGLLARRIVPRVGVGDKLKLGERFGLIRLGSRVDLFLPDDYETAVGIGDKVFAGQTVIARRNLGVKSEG